MLLLAALCGCAQSPRGERSPLAPVTMLPDSVVLELTFVRFPLGRADLDQELWTEVDEQKLPLAVRRSLEEQGMRAGVLSGYLPRSLEKELAKQPAPSPSSEAAVINFDTESTITTRHVQARPAKRVEVVAAGPYPRLPVFEIDAGGSLEGRDYTDAECCFMLRAWPRANGNVRLDLLPELHYGQARPRLAAQPEMGLVYFEPGRDRKAFERLMFDVELAPGEILVLAGRSDRPGSLGHHYFVTPGKQAGAREQKLLLVRLAQTQNDGVFSVDELLDLDQTSPSDDWNLAEDAQAPVGAPDEASGDVNLEPDPLPPQGGEATD